MVLNLGVMRHIVILTLYFKLQKKDYWNYYFF